MSKHRQLVYGQAIPQDFLDALQEFIGMAHSGLVLSVVTPGSVSQPANQVQVAAGSGNSQVGLAIDGLWRYVSIPPAPVSITGAAGTYDIFACTGNNSFAVNPSPPPPEIDSTSYAFTLKALLQGNVPTDPHYRKIGECVFDGTRIIYLRQTLGGGDSYRQFQPGDIKQSATAAPPPGWLLCDGTAVSRATYGVLYAALGGSASPWGQGDGSATFNVPDLRSRTPVAAGQGGGLSSRTLGATGGEENHTLSNGEMPTHSHGGATGGGVTDTQGYHQHYTVDSGQNVFAASVGYVYAGSGAAISAGAYPYVYPNENVATKGGSTHNVTGAAGSHAHNVPSLGIGNDGGGGGHNNMPPWVAVNYWVKF